MLLLVTASQPPQVHMTTEVDDALALTAHAHQAPLICAPFHALQVHMNTEVDDAYGDDSGMKGLHLRDAKTGALGCRTFQPTAALLLPCCCISLRGCGHSAAFRPAEPAGQCCCLTHVP